MEPHFDRDVLGILIYIIFQFFFVSFEFLDNFNASLFIPPLQSFTCKEKEKYRSFNGIPAMEECLSALFVWKVT